MAYSAAKELHEKAEALYLKEHYSRAKKVLLENIAQFPDYAPSHLLLGQIHFFSREPDYDAALREFGEVVNRSILGRGTLLARLNSFSGR
jgi:hypothetical protein